MLLSQSFTQESKGASILLGAKSMMIDFGENVAQCVLGTDSSLAKSNHGDVEQDGSDICIVLCFGRRGGRHPLTLSAALFFFLRRLEWSLRLW